MDMGRSLDYERVQHRSVVYTYGSVMLNTVHTQRFGDSVYIHFKTICLRYFVLTVVNGPNTHNGIY
jgi:hypothetical protein